MELFYQIQIKWNYFIKSVNEGKPEGISLTFDDGPEPKVTKKILDVLELAGVKATFFLIGKKAEQYPDIINLIVSKGHTIGNHSWSHHAGIGMSFMVTSCRNWHVFKAKIIGRL